MKHLLIVANLKSNKTVLDSKEWLEKISTLKSQNLDLTGKKIIVCPSFTLLQMFKDFIDNRKLPIELGAQNISRLPEGPYTGEVNGAQIKDFANYVLVGHSERRGAFGEDESVVEEKIKIAMDYNLIPILCVQGEENKIPKEISIVAYEPVFAVGTGNPDSPEDAEVKAKTIKESFRVDNVLYGGSVTSDNVNRFTNMKDINGVLVGTDSLDPEKFIEIIKNA